MADLETVHATIDHSGVTGVGTPSFSGCKVYNDGTQSISNNSATAITFGAEEYDTDGYHSTSADTSRITIPTGKDGKYRFAYKIALPTNNTTGNRIAFLRKNGVDDTHNVIGSATFTPGSSIAAQQWGLSVTVDLVAGDYIELFFYQDSGGSISVGSAVSSRANVNFLECQFLG